MTEIPIISRLGYKIKKMHQIKPGVFLVMASMEIETTLLVAITTEDEFLDSQVFFDLKSASVTYKKLKQSIFEKKTN